MQMKNKNLIKNTTYAHWLSITIKKATLEQAKGEGLSLFAFSFVSYHY